MTTSSKTNKEVKQTDTMEERFDEQFGQTVFDDEWNKLDAQEKVKDFIRSEKAQDKAEGIKLAMEALKPTFRSSYSGLMGYQVLPDCDEEEHDPKECADCALSELKKQLPTTTKER